MAHGREGRGAGRRCGEGRSACAGAASRRSPAHCELRVCRATHEPRAVKGQGLFHYVRPQCSVRWSRKGPYSSRDTVRSATVTHSDPRMGVSFDSSLRLVQLCHGTVDSIVIVYRLTLYFQRFVSFVTSSDSRDRLVVRTLRCVYVVVTQVRILVTAADSCRGGAYIFGSITK
ncbi:hypothetical protein RR46_02677 [Papilio xuthus]|uniref:Uncharacterized protein n=1 Tax=Papilio xuthus TaxID=66420 RepID=A0A194Q4L4_PAPXU|nr:hypothetical protein RR46_02677 [Papilio xuthus]